MGAVLYSWLPRATIAHNGILGSVSRLEVCQVILTDMKVIDIESLPADPLEALRELSRADVE
ncbi:MAG: hypothetical protein WEA76_08445, partial [Acidimicrobiia bacterium]